jgi:hypothetical protein
MRVDHSEGTPPKAQDTIDLGVRSSAGSKSSDGACAGKLRRVRVRVQASWVLPWFALACADRAAPSPVAATSSTQDRSPCAALCERLATCGPAPDFAGAQACTKTCEDDPRQRAAPCQAPRLAYERCVAALSCEHVRQLADLSSATTGPCGAEIQAVLACEPSEPAAPFIYFQF